jgi:hypothetical protein
MQNAYSVLILLSICGWIKTYSYIRASERPDRLWAHTASYSRGTWVGQVVKMIMSSAQMENGWIYTSIPSYAFMT